MIVSKNGNYLGVSSLFAYDCTTGRCFEPVESKKSSGHVKDLPK
jgi:hypothetical protein